ncbi:MAG: hypothetical protein QNJ91_15285 [Gammaproteobacteria bacterium]|nr:hypothetical protein [Gammaproteobacteria bacterium]
MRLAPAAAADWQLKRFRGGRYLIGRALPGDTKIIVCALGGSDLRITKVFRDAINDGVMFSAEVDCAGASYNAPLNHWSADLENALRFADRTETP